MRKISLLFTTALAGLLLTSCNKGETNPPVLSGIAVTTLPNKTSYLVNEEFDSTGMVVTASYSDESSKILESTDYSVRGFDSSVANTALELTVTYQDKFTKFTVSVSSPVATYSISYHVYIDGVLDSSASALDNVNSSLPTNLASGAAANVYVAANSGYTYDGFYPDSYDYGSDFFDQFDSYTFTEDTFSFDMVSYNVGFNLYFLSGEVKASHEITYTSYLIKDGGDPEDKGNLLFSLNSVLPEKGLEDSNVSVKFVPTSEYTFDHFSIPEEYPASFKEQFNTTSNQFSFEMSTFNVHFDVYFKEIEKIQYSVSFESVEHMTRFKIIMGYPSEYEEGDTVKFYAQPDDNYELSNLPFDTNDSGLVISKDFIGTYVYTFIMPGHDVHLSVIVVPVGGQTTYEIRYAAYVNGELTPGALDSSNSVLPTNLAEGATANVHIVANDGYNYEGFFPDSMTYPDDFLSQFENYEMTEDSFSFSMVGYTVGFNLSFSKVVTETHEVNFASVEHMTFVPSGTTTGILVGSTFSFTISVQDGYVLDGAPYVSDDASISISKSGDVYSLTMPNKDITITATTKEDGGGEDAFGGEYSTKVDMSTPGYYYQYSLIFNLDGTGLYKREKYKPNLDPTDNKSLTFTWSNSGSSLTLTLVSGENTDFTSGYRIFPRNLDKNNPKDVVTNTTGVIVNNNKVTISLYSGSSGTIANTLTFVRHN